MHYGILALQCCDSNMRTYYDILEVSPTASHDQIKKAYFSYLRRVHPDKCLTNSDPDAIAIGNNIWNTLKDSTKREEYNNWIREQELRAKKGCIVETIHISPDELDIEEQCRCGDFYLVTPEEIAQVVDFGVFECGSCSLCLEIVKKD